MSKTVTALLGAAFLLAGSSALAADQGADVLVTTRLVKTHDLNLATIEGRQRLDRRIAVAARLVCRETRSATMIVTDSDCIRGALAAGHQQRDRLFAARGLIGSVRSAAVVR